MKTENVKLRGSEFLEFISRGASRLTQDEVQRLVAQLPDLQQKFSDLRDSNNPEAERQLLFLSKVVDYVWTDRYREMPYGAALEAAFAIAYFVRDGDLIPDSIGPMGLIDDIAVVQTVLARHAADYEAFRAAMKLERTDFPVGPRV